MKNSLRYLELWRKKRSELPLDADPQADWKQMASLLDQHLPVNHTPSAVKAAPAKGLKLISMMLIGLSAAAMTYVISYVASKNSHKHKAQHPNTLVMAKTDSASAANVAQPTVKTDSVGTVASDIENDSKTASDGKNNAAKSSAINNGDSIAEVKNPAATSADKTKSGDAKSANNTQPGAGNSAALLTANVNGSAVVSNSAAAGSAINGKNMPLVTGKLGAGTRVGGISRVSNKTNKTSLSGKLSSGNTHNSVYPLHSSGHNESLGGKIIEGNAIGTASGEALNNEAAYHQNNNMLKDNSHNSFEVLQATSPNLLFTAKSRNNPLTIIYPRSINKPKFATINAITNRKNKDAKSSTPANPLNIDWGLLIGFNSAGSFTPKAQNSNFYGNSPVDPFFGLYAAYNLNDSWSIGLQLRALNPQKISGSYTHANGSSVDSGQVIKITDSRKAYTVDIPLQVIYKVNSNLSFKAGPVFSIPVKVMGGSTTLQPAAIKSDTAYYKIIADKIDSIKYQPKFNYGFSAGVSYEVNRFIFNIDYLKNIGGYQVNSGFGNYKSHNGTLQFTIGFRLNRKK